MRQCQWKVKVSVNETDYRFDGRGRRRSYGVSVFVWRMCCLTQTGNETSCGAGVLLSVLILGWVAKGFGG